MSFGVAVMRRLKACLVFLLALWGVTRGGEQCPPPAANPSCHCFDFENGVFLECPAATAHSLRLVLAAIQGPVQSLSVYDPDKTLVSIILNQTLVITIIC